MFIRYKSLTKTISFAILHFTVGFTVAYLLTGSFGIASAIAIVEPLANTIVFYFHERAWENYASKKEIESLKEKSVSMVS